MAIKNFLKRNQKHIFPFMLLFILVIFTCFKISGSSIGIYHEFLYGKSTKDPQLLFGRPQAIRSDEWLVNTQMAMAQEQNNFGRFNNNFSENKDMSLLVDAPYLEWSVAFKPQNLSFFIMPFENAFAFKWWFMLFALLVSAYYFCLKMLPGKVWLSIALSVILACSPFVFWWYLNGTIAVMTYGFLILLVSMSIIENKPLVLFKKELGGLLTRTIRVLLLSYLLIAFVLLLYPPFQIPIAIVVAFFLLGWLIKTRTHKPKDRLIVILSSFVVAFTITGAVGATYLTTRPDAVHAITHTIYPGERKITSGGYDAKRLLVTYMQPQLQRGDKGDKYIGNQSESSTFILMPLFFVIPAIGLLVWLYTKSRRIECPLFCLVGVTLLFLAQLFMPGVDGITRLFLLHMVPLERLIVGLGFVALILLVYTIKVANDYKLKVPRKIALALFVYSCIFFGISVWAGFETATVYPQFITNKLAITILAGILSVGLALILQKWYSVGATILAIFSLASVVFIHPLYIGLGPLYKSDISKAIQQTSPDGVWAAAEHIYIENFPQISGRRAVTGLAAYPDTDFWKQYSEMPNDNVYNRYAHTVLTANDTSALTLIGPDFFVVSSQCTRKISEKIDYIISTAPLPEQCNQLLRTLMYPTVTFYFYRQ